MLLWAFGPPWADDSSRPVPAAPAWCGTAVSVTGMLNEPHGPRLRSSQRSGELKRNGPSGQLRRKRKAWSYERQTSLASENIPVRNHRSVLIRFSQKFPRICVVWPTGDSDLGNTVSLCQILLDGSLPIQAQDRRPSW